MKVQPYLYLRLECRFPKGKGDNPRIRWTSFAVTMESAEDWVTAVHKVFDTFDAELTQEEEIRLRESAEIGWQRYLTLKGERESVPGTGIAQRLASLRKVQAASPDARIRLGALSKVCRKINYKDFLRYRQEIQGQLIAWYENGDEAARYWLKKRGFRLKTYVPGEPGTLFPSRSPHWWQRRAPYAKSVERRGRAAGIVARR
jgi:hypothetical protein